MAVILNGKEVAKKTREGLKNLIIPSGVDIQITL